MDLTSRLRSIVRPQGNPIRELTYEPDTGRYEGSIDIDRMADVLGGQVMTNSFGRALVIDRRYESDRFHGSRRVGECEVADDERLRLLDPTLPPRRAGVWGGAPPENATERGAGVPASDRAGVWGGAPPENATLFVDLETTGLSGGAGTVAFLVGCGWFDMGAFQVRQFLLTSYASERALLDAVASCFDAASLLVTYNGKTFDVPVMETRWSFHRMRMPLDSVRHFDMLHPARRLWRGRSSDISARASLEADAGGCRLGTLERVLCDVTRVGDVPGLEIPGRYFQFLRTGDVRPLEPVLEHNRLDLISLAAVAAHAVQLVEEGTPRCRDAAEALALGRVYERAGCIDRALDAYRRAADDEIAHVDVRAEAIYRLGVRFRRDRRFDDAAACWRRLLELQPSLRRGYGGQALLGALRQYAVQALAIHHEHRERDYEGAKELALQLLEDPEEGSIRVTAEATKHRLARLEKKIARKNDSHLFG